jgi:NAD(P)-dependent dehydrogenase (short-subunit alcohol dehydrogenase family)
MTKEERIALVTGANKGIGFEVARQLARRNFRVFIGARDSDAGVAAVQKLNKEGEKEDYDKGHSGVAVTFLKIDVSKPDSIGRAAEEFSRSTDRLDVLVNNAGILLDDDKDVLTTTPEIFATTLRTNTLGALLVSQAFVPFMKKSAAPRIVNVSSGGGQLADGADGWAPAYCISKTALNGVTSQLAAALPKIAINSVCPGWVQTEMGGPNATRSVAEGASGIVWLAADAPQKETSKFWRDRKVIPW